MGYSITPHVDRSTIPQLAKYMKSGAVDTSVDARIHSIQTEVGRAYITMKGHPNYKDPVPYKGESQISFTLRAIAHLVSPPQFEGESYDLECVDIAASILAMKTELEEIWNASQS